METQTAYPRGNYSQEHDPNIIGHQHGEGEDEHHHEKKSVLKKVKAKAKKIKDTITKHGHDHNHDHDHHYPEGDIPDDHDLDEEDDEDDDPEVHGAPMYESTAAKNIVSGQPEYMGRPGITDERSRAMHPEPLVAIEYRSENFYTGNADKTKYTDHIGKSSVPDMETLVIEQPKVNFGKTAGFVDEPVAPQNTAVPIPYRSKHADPTQTFVHGQEEYPGQPKVNLQRPTGLEEDPAAPKDTPFAYTTTNYQTKVTDPTGEGGEAIGITPILHSLDKMKVHDEQHKGRDHSFPPGTHHKSSELSSHSPTGSHEQFSPEPTPPFPSMIPENRPLISETMDNQKQQEHSHNIPSDKPSNQSSYTEKISSASSAMADKAVSAKDYVASKLGYGNERDQTHANHESGEGQGATKQASAVDYGKKMATTVTEKLTPLCEKVAEAGSSVISKLHGPSTGTTNVVGTEVPEQDRGVSVKNYVAGKLRPGEEDRALSEVITETLQKRKDDPDHKQTTAKGKVTESEQVARRLGTGEERSDRAGSFPVHTTTIVVDKLKGNEGYSSAERRLQESGN